jgi:hypothetical protein
MKLDGMSAKLSNYFLKVILMKSIVVVAIYAQN